MSSRTRSNVGKASSRRTSNSYQKSQGQTAARSSFSNSLAFEDDVEMDTVDHQKKSTAEKKKRKRKDDMLDEAADSLEEDILEADTDEEQEHDGESTKGVVDSQIDLAKLSEEFRARRANKSAVVRDSYTTKVVSPIVDARQSVISRWEKMDSQMAKRMNQLKASLAPVQFDVSIYMNIGAQRELASQNLCSAYESCTGQIVPEVLGLADDDLNSLHKRVGYVRKEKKKHFASTKKKMNAIQAEQKAITDSHDLLRNFSDIFRKYRPSTGADISNKDKLQKGSGFVSTAHERTVKPKIMGGLISRISRPALHQIV